MSSPISIDAAWATAHMPHTAPDANKYTRGCVLVAGGSAAFPGAPILAAQACARSGAGYTRLAMPRDAAAVARNHVLSIPVTGCTQVAGSFDLLAAGEVCAAAAKSDWLLVGPGLTRSAGAANFLERLLHTCDKPLLLDADALNIVASNPEYLQGYSGPQLVFTPHSGEASRLAGHTFAETRDAREATATEIARRYHAIVVLKGPETLVASAEGVFARCNAGGPELAKAGSGDVLAGMAAGFLAQMHNPLEAVSLAVYLHALCGKRLAARMSVLAVLPEDLIGEIGPAACALGCCAG